MNSAADDSSTRLCRCETLSGNTAKRVRNIHVCAAHLYMNDEAKYLSVQLQGLVLSLPVTIPEHSQMNVNLRSKHIL